MCFTGITAFQSGFDNTVSILDYIIRQLQPETDQILMIRNAGNRSEICLKFAFSHLVNGTPVGQIVRCIVQHILDIGIGTAEDFPSAVVGDLHNPADEQGTELGSGEPVILMAGSQ